MGFLFWNFRHRLILLYDTTIVCLIYDTYMIPLLACYSFIMFYIIFCQNKLHTAVVPALLDNSTQACPRNWHCTLRIPLVIQHSYGKRSDCRWCTHKQWWFSIVMLDYQGFHMFKTPPHQSLRSSSCEVYSIPAFEPQWFSTTAPCWRSLELSAAIFFFNMKLCVGSNLPYSTIFWGRWTSICQLFWGLTHRTRRWMTRERRGASYSGVSKKPPCKEYVRSMWCK